MMQGEVGLATAECSRQHGISEESYYVAEGGVRWDESATPKTEAIEPITSGCTACIAKKGLAMRIRQTADPLDCRGEQPSGHTAVKPVARPAKVLYEHYAQIRVNLFSLTNQTASGAVFLATNLFSLVEG